MMNVLLLQLDGKIPNLALMRVAAHHRALGDAVTLRRVATVEAVEPHLAEGRLSRQQLEHVLEGDSIPALAARDLTDPVQPAELCLGLLLQGALRHGLLQREQRREYAVVGLEQAARLLGQEAEINAALLRRTQALVAALDDAEPLEVIEKGIDLRRVHSMDYTGGHLLEQMRDRLRERGGELLFSGMPSHLPSRPDIESYLGELGLMHGAGVRVFETRDSAIEWMEDRLLEAAGWQAPDEEVLLGLGGIELFADLDADSLRELATVVSARSVAAGEKVCSRGDTGDELFLIQRGRVQVLLPLEGGKVHHLATLGSGDYFGDLAFLDREPRTADVVAAVPTDLYVLSRQRFDELVRRNPAMGGRVFEQLAYAISKRLRATDVELQALEAR